MLRELVSCAGAFEQGWGPSLLWARCVGEETGMCVGDAVLSLPREELHTHSHVCYAHTWPRTQVGSVQYPSPPQAPWGAWPH